MAARTLIAALALAVAVALTGCGISAEDDPRLLSANDVPFDLLEVQPTTTTTAVEVPVTTVAVESWFVKSGQLVPVSRNVSPSNTLRRAIEKLLEGPDEVERQAGLRSAINPKATEDITVERAGGGVATINISRAFSEGISTQEQLLAFAQLVYTATSVGEITKVQFTLGGEPVEVPLPSGQLANGPVGRDQFAQLALPPPPPPPAPPPPEEPPAQPAG